MSNKFPVYLAKIKTSLDGTREFVREDVLYKEMIWGTPYNKFFFKLRKTYFNKPNCNLNCPPGKEYFCCKDIGCKKHCGFFEWEEISFFSDKEREEILSLWDNRTGFHRKNCALPRELRSYICLTFKCRYSEENKKR